jgi:hypothetical protein
MDGSARRSRFETRVLLEREFLTRVNGRFGQFAPLAGMTRGAIDSWAARAAQQVDVAWVSDIAGLLIEVSTRADLMADNSKDVFEPSHRPPPDSLDELRSMLQSALSREAVS